MNKIFFYSFIKQNLRGVDMCFYTSSFSTERLNFIKEENSKCKFVLISSQRELLIAENQGAKFALLTTIYEIYDFSFAEFLDIDIRVFIENPNNTPEKDKLCYLALDSGWDLFVFDSYNKTVYRDKKTKNGFYGKTNDFYIVSENKSLCFLYFLHSSFPGGAEVSAFDTTANMVNKYGVVPIIVTPDQGIMVERFNEIGVPVLILQYTWWTKKYQAEIFESSFFINFNWAKEIYKINPHLFYTQTLVIPWAAIIANLFNKHHIWNIREFGVLDHSLEFLLPFQKILTHIQNMSSFVTTCGEKVKQELFATRNLSKVSKAYTNISLNLPQNIEASNLSKKETFKLILPATIRKSKGQMDAVLAVDNLVKKGIDNIHLLLVGYTGGEYCKNIRRFVERENLQKNIEIRNFSHNVHQDIYNCDALLSCSVMEAFGRTIMEAMLMKRPVIASNTGGNSEIIEDGINGFLYSPGDYKKLSEKIEILMKDNSICKQIGENGFNLLSKKVAPFYSEDVLYDKSLELKKAPLKNRDEKSLLLLLNNLAEYSVSGVTLIYLKLEHKDGKIVSLIKSFSIRNEEEISIVISLPFELELKRISINLFYKNKRVVSLESIALCVERQGASALFKKIDLTKNNKRVFIKSQNSLELDIERNKMNTSKLIFNFRIK